MALAALNAQDRVEQLIVLTDRLTELMVQQARAFEGRRPQDAAANLEETQRLANLYRHESSRVRADPSLIAGISNELRGRLVQATEAFDAVLARQGRALNAAKTITEGLVCAIAEEVSVQRGMGNAYGPGGAAPAAGSATAITLNKRA